MQKRLKRYIRQRRCRRCLRLFRPKVARSRYCSPKCRVGNAVQSLKETEPGHMGNPLVEKMVEDAALGSNLT